MEETASKGEGNRDRAGEWLSMFGIEEPSKVDRERKILSFHSFLALSTHTIPIRLHYSIDNITLIGQSITSNTNTQCFFQHVLFFSISHPWSSSLVLSQPLLCVILRLLYLEKADMPPSHSSG